MVSDAISLPYKHRIGHQTLLLHPGDMVDIIWEPRLTQGWENAPDAYLDIPFNKSAFFSPQAVQVGGAAINTVAELQELLSRPGGSKTGCIQEAL